MDSQQLKQKCDVLVLMYDQADNESKAYVEEVSEKFSKFVPRVLVHDKLSGAWGGASSVAGADSINIL